MVIFLLILLTVSAYYLTKDIFHPAFMMLFLWTLGFCLLRLLPGFYFPSMETQSIILSYLVVFILPSLGISLAIKDNPQKNKYESYLSYDAYLFKFFLIFFSVVSLYCIYEYVLVFLNFNTLREYFFHVRYAAVHTNEPLVKLNSFVIQSQTYAMLFTVVAFYAYLVGDNTKLIKLLILSFISIFLFSSLMGGSRKTFIYTIFSLMTLYIMLKGSMQIFKVVFIFIVLFFIISIYTRGGAMLADDFFIAVSAFFSHLFMYAFGSIASFQAFLQNDITVSSSIMVKIIDKVDAFLGVFGYSNFLVQPKVNQGVFTHISDDMSTNVYSFLSVRIYYFGFLGAAFVTALHAILITIAYEFSRKNNIMFFLYIIMVPTTVLSLFHEYFYASTPYFTRMAILILYLYYIKPFVKIKRSLKI